MNRERSLEEVVEGRKSEERPRDKQTELGS